MSFVRRYLLALIMLFLVAPLAHAEVKDAFVEFNSRTLEKGYTVCSGDQSFCVPVLPKQFKNKLAIKIGEPSTQTILPEDTSALSEVYLLDIKPDYKGVLKTPVNLVFQVPNLTGRAGIYFYDNCKAKWRELDSMVNLGKNTIKASINFPYVQVVVLGPKVRQVDENGLTAEAALVMDKDTGEILFTKNPEEVRPIASLTKLTTVLTFLDLNPGWDKKVKMEKSDFVGGASLWVKPGDEITVRDLFYSTLVGSKNNAAMALARSTGLSISEFVARMNQKVASLGLKYTYFVEPTGLNESNVSTAEELGTIAREVFKNMDVVKASTTRWYKVTPTGSEVSYWVKNTSMKMLDKDLYVTGSKTGWTDEAGYCLVTQAKKDNHEILALVMGSAITKNYEEVYSLLKKNL